MLGPVGVLLAILLGCISGVVFGVPRLLISRQHWMPFGPFLSLGAFAVLVFREEIVHFIEHDYAEFMTGLFL
jgi:prepilin signal peptidase PulO-like enzyme (type II secretory pathway)